MSSYLAQWVDPELAVGEVRIDDIRAEEAQRLAHLLAIAVTAQNIPRRVGGDASSEDLAQDKRRCKRVAHVAQQLLEAWTGSKHVTARMPDVSKEAAVVDWDRWWSEHRTWLINRRVFLATACHKGQLEDKWCKSALVKLTNEISWLEYAMR